jgi:hypothetical protein
MSSKEQGLPRHGPGPAASLWPSEVLTLAVVSQWNRFRSERDFYRFATQHLRPYFPRLPSRPQFNRLLRRHQDALTRFALWLAARLGATTTPYEVLDGTAIPTRNAKRRGRGWLAGLADIGKCLRRGWIHGLRVLACAAPDGPVTGWGTGPASTNDRALAETLFAVRRRPQARLPSVGYPASSVYVADTGFAGTACEAHWVETHWTQVVAPPQDIAKWAWPGRDRRWLAGLREVARWWRASSTGCKGRSASTWSGRIPSTGFSPGWRRRWRCTMSAFSSTGNTVSPIWPSLISPVGRSPMDLTPSV